MSDFFTTSAFIVPMITLGFTMCFIFLSYIPYIPSNFDFKVKFLFSGVISVLLTVYAATHLSSNFIAMAFGTIVSILILRSLFITNFYSFKLNNAIVSVKIIELIYNLRKHPENVKPQDVLELEDKIEQLASKNYKDYIKKLIKRYRTNRLNSEPVKSEESSSEEVNSESS
jgi:hypothetical protein